MGELHDGVQYEFVPESIEGPDQIKGEIHFSPPVEFNGIRTVDFVDIQGSDMDSGVVRIQLNKTESTKKSLQVKYENDSSHLPLLSAPVFYAVYRVLDGDIAEAQEVIHRNYPDHRPEWEFRNNCRDTLQFDDFLQVLDNLSGFSDEFSHVQFRSGIGYFAKRILDNVPSAIYSFDELQDRIREWNSADNLKHIELSEVIGEKLGREYYRDGLSNERSELLEIGFNPISYDPEWSTVAPACWIAHIVLTDSVEPAREYAVSRPKPVDHNYEKLKSDASNASFGERGELWGKVVAHPKNQDFQFEAFNHLRWIGREYRGKAKIQPLLLAGAKEIAPAPLSPEVFQKLEIQKQLSIGHIWRRDRAHSLEEEAFQKARNLATGGIKKSHELQADLLVEAEASLAHARVSRLGGGPEDMIPIYREAMEEIQRLNRIYDIHPKKVENRLDFLEERIEETETWD